MSRYLRWYVYHSGRLMGTVIAAYRSDAERAAAQKFQNSWRESVEVVPMAEKRKRERAK